MTTNVIFSFFAGWLVGKIMDWGWKKTKGLVQMNVIKYRLNKRKKSDKSNYTPHISILVESIENFDVSKNIQICMSDHTFLLATPREIVEHYPETFSYHSSTDKWLPNCGPKELERLFNLPDISKLIDDCKKIVTDDFLYRKEGCYYNNFLYGIMSSDYYGRTCDTHELPILTLNFYKTDYFTHRVMWQLTQQLRNMEKLPNVLLYEDQLNDVYRSFRTSLGVSLIAILPATNEIVLTKRSKNSAYGEGKEWIYVSVTETISETDFDDTNNKLELNVKKWIKRGLNEELGLIDNSEHYNTDSIRIYDMFFENYFYQDGLTASIELSRNMNIEQIRALPAKDKKLETKEIFTIPNTRQSIEKFIQENANDMREQTIFALQSYKLRLMH